MSILVHLRVFYGVFLCVLYVLCVSVCLCRFTGFFQFSADSHLLHLFITGLNAVTLSSCTVPQASLRSDGCVSALPPENPTHHNKSISEKLALDASW